MKPSKIIVWLLVLNVAVASVLFGRWLYKRGEADRDADAKVAAVGHLSESMKSLKSEDFKRLIDIARLAKRSGKISDQDLDELMRMPNRVQSSGSGDFAEISTIGALYDVRSFSDSQTSLVHRFLSERLTNEGQHPMRSIMAAKLAIRLGMPEGRSVVESLRKSPDGRVARLATLLGKRLDQKTGMVPASQGG